MTFEQKWQSIINLILTSPLTGLAITLLVYCAAIKLYKQSGHNALVNPVILSVVTIITILLITGINYQDYYKGGQYIHFFLGPAVVALAVPLYLQIHRIKKLMLPIFITLIDLILPFK